MLSVTLVALISGSLWKYRYKTSVTVTVTMLTAKMLSINITFKSVIPSKTVNTLNTLSLRLVATLK